MASSRSLKEHKRAYQRKYYADNLELERQKARVRAECVKQRRTFEEIESHKARHRIAQAQYRGSNRLKLKMESWQYRCRKKRERASEIELMTSI